MREWVVARFRDLDNETLKQHVGLPGSDGQGELRILCKCRLAYEPAAWFLHLKGVVAAGRRRATKP